MEQFHLFEVLPLWVTFIGIVVLVLFSIWLGVYIGKKRFKTELEGPIGTAASATLGLLAFILAFTFGLTSSRYDARRQLLLDEITAIETTALRADLIPEPHRSEVRVLLTKYVDGRMALIGNRENIAGRIKEAEEIQRQLWAHAAALADADLKNADIVSLFVDSVNELINMQTRRITVGTYHIPWLIWLVLFGVTILSMLEVGYLFGKSEHNNWLFIIALALAFSGVMILIVDLDRAGMRTAASIQVNQQPLIDLHERLSRTSAK